MRAERLGVEGVLGCGFVSASSRERRSADEVRAFFVDVGSLLSCKKERSAKSVDRSSVLLEGLISELEVGGGVSWLRRESSVIILGLLLTESVSSMIA